MITGIDKFQKDANLPSESEFANLEKQAKIFIESGFLPPSIKTPAQAITIAMKGRELGIPPMQAFSQINIIQGKPAMSGELMLAMCYRGCPTAVIEFIESDNKKCVLEAKRRQTDKASKFKFDLDDATTAGLMLKDSWKKYPAAMLRARAISAMARAMFPDCLMGCSYTAEELGAEVTIDGEIKSVEGEVITTTSSESDSEAKALESHPLMQEEKAPNGTMMDFKSAIESATTGEEVSKLMREAKTKVSEDDLKILKAHSNLAYKRIQK